MIITRHGDYYLGAQRQPSGRLLLIEGASRLEVMCCRDIWLDTPRVVCAYCKGQIRPGSEPVSHGACEPCAEKVLA